MSDLTPTFQGLSKKILQLNPEDHLGLLEIQTELQELAFDLESYPEAAELAKFLSDSLDPLYSGSSFDFLKDPLYKGLDVLENAIFQITNHQEAGFNSDEWHLLVGHEIKAFFTKRGDKSPPSEAPSEQKSQTETHTDQLKPLGPPNTEPVVPSDLENLEQILQSDFFDTFINDGKNKTLEAQDLILDLEEENPEDFQGFNDLFRTFHTLKGEAGFLGLKKIADLTHQLESLLDPLRKGEEKYTTNHTDALLFGMDCIRDHLLLLEKHQLNDYLARPTHFLSEQINTLKPENHQSLGQILKEMGLMTADQTQEIASLQKQNNYRQKYGETALETGLVSGDNLEKALSLQREKDTKSLEKRDSVINIRSSQVLELATMVQELWIAEHQVAGDEILPIKKITSRIQHLAMAFLTVKVNKLYTKLRRLVRDTAKKAGKEIQAYFLGNEMEIDRTLVETLEEPLLHIVRNAIDHGIESAQDRESRGKALQGQITISTNRRGNKIIISIKDDGKGLDPSDLLRKALEKGLISDEDARKLSHKKTLELITLPGFSTAEEVTELSGRGVGMDAVVSMIQENNGRLEILSNKGEGTQFNLIFPLNVAIVDGMVLSSGKDIFVIPVSEIVECVQIQPENIELFKGKKRILRLRGEVIPVVNLERVFGDEDSHQRITPRAAVVVNHENNKYALLVSDIIEKAEVAIKPLGKKFAHLKGISSGTVFSGGSIGFILDIEQIINELFFEESTESQ